MPASSFAAAGDLDPTFGGDGIVTTAIDGFRSANAISIQADGKIVTAGVAGSSNDTGVARFNTDGTLDTTFGGDGVVRVDAGGYDLANAVAVQPDGKIIVAGIANLTDMSLLRFNANGTLDTSFGGDGIVTTDVSGVDWGLAMALQADGKIVTVGLADNGANSAFVRHNTDGSLDTTFGGDGTVVTNVSGFDQANKVVVQADGKIVTAGYANNGADTAMMRYNADGSLDASFDGDGIAITDLGGIDVAQGVTLQPDGKIVTIGYVNSDTALARYNTDGTLDASFDSDGKVITDVGGADQGFGVVVQADGKIIAAGVANGVSTALTRYNADGSLDNSFGDGGSIVTDVTDNLDSAQDVALQADGKIVTAGESATGLTVLRYLSKPQADVAVSVAGTGSLVTGVLTVTTTVGNSGPDAATGVVTTTQLPPSTTTVTGMPAGCTWTSATRVVTCTISTLNAGSTVTRAYRAHISPLAFGSLPLATSRTASVPQDPNPTNDHGTDTCNALTGLMITC
ncbi:hypothetical protein [Streptomyces virginiae]|uniref:hypothetical protein n=1 Tax=Streptomyces virginiae TaxID=1961 RepID=UPI00332D347E